MKKEELKEKGKSLDLNGSIHEIEDKVKKTNQRNEVTFTEKQVG